MQLSTTHLPSLLCTRTMRFTCGHDHAQRSLALVALEIVSCANERLSLARFTF
jgi:hypothetical protein